MNLKDFFMYYRAILVSILATSTDIGIMYGLSSSALSENATLAISSFSGLLIQFFGQKFWTFKNRTTSTNALIKQVGMFFGLELSIIACIIVIYDKIYDPISQKIKELPDSYSTGVLSKYLFKKGKKGKIILTTTGQILLKSCLVFLAFNIISYPLWKYVIFAKK